MLSFIDIPVSHRKFGSGFLCLALFLFLSFVALSAGAQGEAKGTSASEKQSADGDAKGAKEQLVWPPPPLDPRIRYVTSIATSDDVRGKKGFWRKLWEFFRGPQIDTMVKPMGVAVDRKERIYVADPAAKRVHLFEPRKKRYRFIESVGEQRLQFPINVDVDDEGNLYIVDGLLKRVFSLSASGKPGNSYGKQGQLQRPSDVAADLRRNLLYVVDPPAHNIKVFDLKSGMLKRVIGKRGIRPGEFNFPAWLVIDGDGRLSVTDSLNGRIQILSKEGEPLSSFGKLGDGTGDFVTPKGIALDSDGHLYVADAGFDNVQIFDAKGRLLLYFGGSGQAAGLFWMPGGIYIDHRDRIYVADSYNRRIQVFQYLKKLP